MSLHKFPCLDELPLDVRSQLTHTDVPRTERTAIDSGRRFVSGHPNQIVVGTVRLEQYLHDRGEWAALKMACLLDHQDWKIFEHRYAATGRAPYSPRSMMGLILYGLMQGVHSLRSLERLARLDLGCIWVCKGITPDHAVIGRFIVLHNALLSEVFFESLTRSILQACGSSHQRVAGDGTVIEAACSYYKMLKEDAVRVKTKVAHQALAQQPTDPQLQQAVRRAQQCEDIFVQRKDKRQKHGKSTDSLSISGNEPEAMVQRLKRGRGFAASYKPSVLANEDRMITAIAVDPSSETAVVAQMLDQHARISGSQVNEVLLDAGYFDDEVINTTLKRGISLLCPLGKETSYQITGKFHKNLFRYDEQTDTYHCPAQQILSRQSSVAASALTREHRVYAAQVCTDCSLRGCCTTAKVRKIKRYPEDEVRQALSTVMSHPMAQRVFRQRKAMVEPVFAVLRYQQKLNRFRRRGLVAVRSEFALHAMAYNLGRALTLLNSA